MKNMSNQHNGNYQTNEQKAPPPAEVSLKFMAWDVKKIGQSLEAIAAEMQAIRKTLEHGRF